MPPETKRAGSEATKGRRPGGKKQAAAVQAPGKQVAPRQASAKPAPEKQVAPRQGPGVSLLLIVAVVVGLIGLTAFALRAAAPAPNDDWGDDWGSAPSAGSAPATSSQAAAKAAVTAEDGVVRLPADDFADGVARFYNYQASSGKTITFFVLQSSDGVIRAAFDACDVCYGSKRGYRQEGDYMVCNNCGNRFASVSVNVETGGCNPAALDRELQGDTVIIRASDIEAGGRFF